MKKIKIACGILLSTLLISCGSSEENNVKKYLPGTYTRQHKEGESIRFGYHKEVTIKHLKENQYRITCIENDDIIYTRDDQSRVVTKKISKTPDVYDMEISSITLKQKTDSAEKYYIEGIVTNVVANGTTFSSANKGVNNTAILNFIIGKNSVEVNLGGNGLLAVRKK